MSEQVNTRKQTVIYKVIIVLLLIVIIILVVQLIRVQKNVSYISEEKQLLSSEKEHLQRELNELMLEHERIKQEYQEFASQLSEKDSIILAQAREIEKLIQSQADYRRIRRQLDYLRSITQNYVRQIDSLYQINQQLVEENQQIRRSLDVERQRSFQLEQQTRSLEEKISSEAFLRAYNPKVTTYTLRGSSREAETDKARRVDIIRVCFTLSENYLVEPGQKDIFIRIARPDNFILTQGSYQFVYQGNRIHYTEKTTVIYDNKAKTVCIDYRRGEAELLAGQYHVNIFADDRMIGECAFDLR